MALRNVHSTQELHVQRATFGSDDSIVFDRNAAKGHAQIGAPVVMTGSLVVGLAPAGATPFGALERVDADGSVVVAWHGAVEYTGTPGFGVGVVADGAGAVRAAATGEIGKGVAMEEAHAGKIIVFQ